MSGDDDLLRMMTKRSSVTAPGGTNPSDATDGMMWYGMVNVNLYSALSQGLSRAEHAIVSREQPGFQALIVLLCAEIVRQGVPGHGAVPRTANALI